MKKIDVLETNYAKLLEENDALITVQKGDKLNAMTIGWGMFGVMWEKPVAVVAVRPQRYTHTFLEEEDFLSVNLFDKKPKDLINYMGTNSGRDKDKLKEMGLTVAHTEDIPWLKEADYNILCRVLYKQALNEKAFVDTKVRDDNYAAKDFHTVYIAEIVGVEEGDGKELK